MKKKGDYVKILRLTKTGHLTVKWVKPSTLKKFEFVRISNKKGHVVNAIVPRTKIGHRVKSPKVGGDLTSNKVYRITLHIKIDYNKSTANKYIPNGKEFYLEAFITKEVYAEDINKELSKMQLDLEDSVKQEFFSRDDKNTLLGDPYLTNGVVKTALTSESPSGTTTAHANYRYSKSQLLKHRELI